MALQSSGAISLNEIHVEAGGSSGSQCSLNDQDIRDLISKNSGAQMSFNEWYGASSYSGPTGYQLFTNTGVVSTMNSIGYYYGFTSGTYQNVDVHTFTVPSGVSEISFVAVGGGGGSGGSGYNYASSGGCGGGLFWIKGLKVTAGDTLYFFTGYAGGSGSSYTQDGKPGGPSGLAIGNGSSGVQLGAAGGWGGYNRYYNNSGLYSARGPGRPIALFSNMSNGNIPVDPVGAICNGMRGGWGATSYYNGGGGGGGGAGGYYNTNNVTISQTQYNTGSNIFGGGSTLGGINAYAGSGRSWNSNTVYWSTYSTITGNNYSRSGGGGSYNYRSGGGGVGYDGRNGTQSPSGYGVAGATGGSTNGGTGNSSSYGGNYGGGGGSDDDDYVGAGSRGGYGMVKIIWGNPSSVYYPDGTIPS